MSHKKIIAVDFDGTLVDNEYPNIGRPIRSTITELLKEQAAGARIILWTCREGEYLLNAIDWCYLEGIELDGINANLRDVIESFGGTDTRKIFAHEYWDDRAREMPIRKSAWISVKDRLPEAPEPVLIYSDDDGVAEGAYLPTKGYWIQFRKSVRFGLVTHWQSLPDPPDF